METTIMLMSDNIWYYKAAVVVTLCNVSYGSTLSSFVKGSYAGAARCNFG
jgi:hypothetical protein